MIFNYLHQNFNKPLSLLLNNFTENIFIEKIVYIFSDLPIFFIPIFLISFWLYYNFKKENKEKSKLLFIFYSIILALIFSIFIQNLIHIDRPEESLKAVWKIILKHIPDASFPSDHASVSWAFLWSLFLFWYKKYFIIFWVFFIIMLLSRIAWWIHWPLDIIVWLVVWIFGSFIIYKLQNFSIFQSINTYILKFSSYFKL